jgi:hypothetical protein
MHFPKRYRTERDMQLTGSVAETVICSACCPVLVMRDSGLVHQHAVA